MERFGNDKKEAENIFKALLQVKGSRFIRTGKYEIVVGIL
jgi:hypothetical protein